MSFNKKYLFTFILMLGHFFGNPLNSIMILVSTFILVLHVYKSKFLDLYYIFLLLIAQLIKDIRKHQDIRTSSEEALSKIHSKLCSKVVENFNVSKAQQPAGILDTTDGEYRDYFVWAGGLTKDVPDASEPGIVVVLFYCYSF